MRRVGCGHTTYEGKGARDTVPVRCSADAPERRTLAEAGVAAKAAGWAYNRHIGWRCPDHRGVLDLPNSQPGGMGRSR